MTAPMSFADYAAIPALNWSRLKAMAVSPLHFHHAMTAERADTPAMFLGRAIHCAVLEPDSFPLRYAVYTGGRRAGADWDAFKAANSDKEILKADEYERCLAIRDAVRSHPVASTLFTGSSEVVRTWTDPATGIDCKCRIDHLSDHATVDLKSTGDLDERLFMQTAARLSYHGQAAYYQRGADACDLPYYIVAVESAAPYDVAVFEYPEWVLAQAQAHVDELLSAVAYHREHDIWPGRYPGLVELGLPKWAEDEAGDGWGSLPERSTT